MASTIEPPRMSHDHVIPTRRSLLTGIGAGIAAGLVGTGATAQDDQSPAYALVQGDDCVPIQPVEGSEPVRSLYEYRLPERFVSEENGAVAGETGLYASAGTTSLQRARTSVAFLYRGPGGLHLVVVHGSATAEDGGSVTFQCSGLPADGEWHVKDDLYRDPDTGELAASNYDRWNVSGTEHRIDWTWGSSGTDGGAFGALGADFDVVITPAFNEAATLYGEHYEGTVTDWEFLAGSDGQERIALRMDEPIRIVGAPCEEIGASDPGDEDDDSGRGPPDDPGRGPPDDDPGRGPPDDDPGRGPPDDDPGRGPPDDDPGRGPPDDDGRGPGDRDSGSDRGRGRGNRGRGRGR
jgi:hypothetical protein